MRYYNEELHIYYQVKDNRIIVTDADKKIAALKLPSKIDDYPVCVIERKAFLGCKGLREIALPDTIEKIGEWAFAYCDNLTRISLPRKKIELGKGVLKDDLKVNQIVVRDRGFDAASEMMVSRLLAVVATVMDAEYMMDALEAGSEEMLVQ